MVAQAAKIKLTTHFPWITLFVLLASAVASGVPALSGLLVFDREAILGGELWRLFSSHLVHFDARHWAYDAVAFGLAGWIVESKNYRHFPAMCLSAAFAICTVLLRTAPDMRYYGGLSGLACAAIGFGALHGASEPPPFRTICRLVLVLLPLKLVIEVITQTPLLPYEASRAFVAMPSAHVVGLLAAVAVFMAFKAGQGSLGIHRLGRVMLAAGRMRRLRG